MSNPLNICLICVESKPSYPGSMFCEACEAYLKKKPYPTPEEIKNALKVSKLYKEDEL